MHATQKRIIMWLRVRTYVQLQNGYCFSGSRIFFVPGVRDKRRRGFKAREDNDTLSVYKEVYPFHFSHFCPSAAECESEQYW